ncbi:hypothetical protein Ndes2526B_g02400 [Nannochloris sp. 'desiccata']|nr:hypothetical protein KSW81_003283 [Chlorella desiccata (nom. nud.)]KAH7623100.1 putative Purple acid phosphatase 17 [Chlorella desiccata (nom. nud.)]
MLRNSASSRRDIEAATGVTEPLLEPISPDSIKLKPSSRASSSQDGAMALDAEFAQPASLSRQTVFLVGTSILLVLIALLEFAIALPMLWKIPSYHSYPRFFVIGDWGRDGDYNQSVVADSMARKAGLFHPDFIISTGDNFYEAGLVSADDRLFDSSFKDIYSHAELVNVPWHVVLGNHDYGETDSPKSGPKGCSHAAKDNDECFYGPAHQLDVRLTARDPRWHCERLFSVPLTGGDVEIFFIDSTPIIRSYVDEVWAGNRGGVLQQSPEDQIRELEARLAASHASWKLVVGHHPIRTNHRPDYKFEDMVADVEPLLIEHGVQAYFAGHDHNLQYLHDPDSGYHHIISGAGSKIGGGFYGDKHSPFQWPGNGFVAVEMQKKIMRIEYIGVDSDEPLFTIDIPRDV